MIRLGITGHRPNRLPLAPDILAGRVKGALCGLISAAAKVGETGAVLDIQSPLAEGADRIVAAEAIALGQTVTALLPMAEDAYERTFADDASRLEFRKLLADSSDVLHIGSRERRHLAFSAVGIVTVARSDLMLTIWDGKGAEGPGGTPEILQAALDAQVPVIWVDAVRDREPLLLRAEPGEPETSRAFLTAVARHAKPLTPAAYRALAAAAVSL